MTAELTPRLEYLGKQLPATLRTAWANLGQHQRDVFVEDYARRRRSTVAMVVLAVLFPIQFFFLHKAGLGIACILSAYERFLRDRLDRVLVRDAVNGSRVQPRNREPDNSRHSLRRRHLTFAHTWPIHHSVRSDGRSAARRGLLRRHHSSSHGAAEHHEIAPERRLRGSSHHRSRSRSGAEGGESSGIRRRGSFWRPVR